MASALPVISREEINFLKVANLLIRHSPRAVRILFDREFNPSGLTSVLSKNRIKLDKLKKKHVITQTQWSLLYPSGSLPDSSNFDLTLMVCLLRNLTKIAIQDKLPQPSDLSEGAAVSRIKFYRNQIAHSDSGAMSDSEFSKTFDEVSMAIEMICPPMKTDCETLKLAHIDHSVHDIYLEFVKNEKQMEEMKQQQEELVAQVEILNFERQNMECVPGSGKSAIAYHVAIYMQETEGYTVVPIWIPSELIKLANSNAKQLFIFDDVFGKYSLNEFNLNCWESETRRIKMLLNNKILKVMVTCRSYLYDNVRDSLSSQSFAHFNMQSDEINLSLVERKEISKLYLTDDVVSHLHDETVMMYNCFPLLCVMFKEKNMDNADFFQNPSQFIENEIENFKRKRDISFIGLALLVLSNNSIQKDGLQIGKDKYDRMLQDLFDELDIRKCPSKTSILLNLQNLKNMYLDETESFFCSKHDKIFDIISHTVGYFIIRCILRHGESAFISSRCQLISLNEEHGDCTIMITDELEPMYFERIFRDIENGLNWEVFGSIQMKFENYRKLFMQYLENMSPKFVSSIHSFTTPLHVTSSKGYFDISNFLLEKNREHISFLDDHKRSPLHQAAVNGHHDLVTLFLRNGASVDQLDNNGYTALLTSCHYGYSKVVEELIKHHSSINICGNDGWYPLHFAASDGNTDIVKLLLNHKDDVNRQMMEGMTPLYTACANGNLNAVKLLIEGKAEVNKCENGGWSPLHVACFEGFNEIAEVLVINGADMNKNANNGQTPLYNACNRNHINTVKLLLKHGMFVNKGNENEIMPLHIACEQGNKDIVQILCEHGALTNHCSKGDFTPLHYFCDRDYTSNAGQSIIKGPAAHEVGESGKMQLISNEDSSESIIELLISHGADINCATTVGNTPIYLACKCNNLEAVKRLLHYEVDANKCNNNGWSPLHIASLNGNGNTVKILLKHGVSIDKCNEEGLTPLLVACFNGNKNIAELLFKEGAAFNKFDNTGNSALLIACKYMHNEIASVLLENGAEVNEHDQNGRTSLHCAAEDGNSNLINILIKHNANINFQLNNGMTPIYKACKNNHLEAVKMLCRFNADINKCEKGGFTPLHVASRASHEEVVSYLCENSSAVVNLTNTEGYSPLHLACRVGTCNRNIAELLIKAGAEVNKVTKTGNSPLLLATNHGNDTNNEIALLLLANGADVNSNDKNGRTSLHFAAEDGNLELINYKILMEHEANINFQLNNGMTSIYIACMENQLEALKMLLSYKADINKCQENGWSPLHISSYDNHRDVVEYLCEHGNAEVNLCNKKGETPLQFACKKGNKDVVKLLLKYGASINHRDQNGFTSFHKACSKGNISIVELLIKEDAAVNCPDRSDRTPLYIACKRRHRDVVELLLKHGAELNNAAQVYSEEGWTPLHVSVASGNTRITELLLQNKAAVNVEDRNGHTPLYYATQNRLYEIIELLVSQGTVLSNNDVQTPSLSRGSKRRKQCVIQ